MTDKTREALPQQPQTTEQNPETTADNMQPAAEPCTVEQIKAKHEELKSAAARVTTTRSIMQAKEACENRVAALLRVDSKMKDAEAYVKEAQMDHDSVKSELEAAMQAVIDGRAAKEKASAAYAARAAAVEEARKRLAATAAASDEECLAASDEASKMETDLELSSKAVADADAEIERRERESNRLTKRSRETFELLNAAKEKLAIASEPYASALEAASIALRRAFATVEKQAARDAERKKREEGVTHCAACRFWHLAADADDPFGICHRRAPTGNEFAKTAPSAFCYEAEPNQ